MDEILKRLEIIKSSIQIKEYEIVELQVAKLEKQHLDEEIQKIVTTLKELKYYEALLDIESYIAQYSALVRYVDIELQALKQELKQLETKIQILLEQKGEYLNLIEEFNIQYNLKLGDLIGEILSLQKELDLRKLNKQKEKRQEYEQDKKLYEESKKTVDEIKSSIDALEVLLEKLNKDDERYDKIYQAYKQLKEELNNLEEDLKAQEEKLEKNKEFIDDKKVEDEYKQSSFQYEEFNSKYEEIKKEVKELSQEAKEELKKLFRKAAKLCHPDIVPNELKEKAHKIMQELNNAYTKQDIDKVKEILSLLENGNGFEYESDSINDKEILKKKIDEYRQHIKKLEKEIEDIKNDETYQTILEINDWDEYFRKIRDDLEEERNSLKSIIAISESRSDLM